MAYANKLNLKQVRIDTETRIEEMLSKVEVLNGVYEVLKRFEGKKISKRVETAVRDYFNDKYTVSLTDGRNDLHIWGNNIPYNTRLSVFLGYSGGGQYGDELSSFSFAAFTKNHMNKAMFVQAIEESKNALANIEQIVTEYNAALDALDAAKDKLRGLNYP